MPLKLVQTLTGHSDRVWTLAWNPAGTILASSGSDKTVRLWAKENEDWVCVSILTDTHRKSIRRVCWSPCGQFLATASFDSTVCIWKRNSTDASWSTVVNLEGHENEVKSVAWSYDGRYLASCGRDRTVWIWERVSNDDIDDKFSEEDSAENWDCSDVKNDHTKDVKHILWHPNHNILVSCSYDDSVKFFNKQGDDWKCFETIASHSSTVWSADFSPSGEYLVTCSDDRTVRVWKNHAHSMLPDVECNSWKCISVIQGYHSRAIYDVSWSKIDDLIVSASGDNSLVIYGRSIEKATNKELYTCIDKTSSSHNCDVNSVAWNTKMTGLLASGSDDCSIKLWNYKDAEKGMSPNTIADEILKSLDFQYSPSSTLDFTKKITDFSTLLNLTKSLQNLQNEVNVDYEKSELVKLLSLDIKESNPEPLRLTSLQFGEDGICDGFTIEIVESGGDVKYRVIVVFEKLSFRLTIPRRSSNLLHIEGEIFLLEKTGDLHKILASGTTQFLLGHLFMFSDIRFVIKKTSGLLTYIISADRDEKIRITNYPNTFDIERYCFGHKSLVRRLLLVDETSFVSIDQQNTLCLWDLSNIKKLASYDQMIPKKILSLEGSALKRARSSEKS